MESICSVVADRYDSEPLFVIAFLGVAFKAVAYVEQSGFGYTI